MYDFSETNSSLGEKLDMMLRNGLNGEKSFSKSIIVNSSITLRGRESIDELGKEI